MIGGPISGEQLVGVSGGCYKGLNNICAAFGCTGVSLMKKLMLSFGDQGISQRPLPSAWPVVNTASIGAGSHWFMLFVETLFDPSDEAVGLAPASPTQTTQRGAARLHRSPNNDHLEQVPVQPSKAMRTLFS